VSRARRLVFEVMIELWPRAG